MSPAAGTVDLRLPDYPTLVARAGVDPRVEARRVAGADPGAVAGVSTAFGRAGGEMDTAWTQSMGAADTLGRGFTNDGTAVLDRATHVANLPPEFGDAGTRLAGASRRLGAVAEDLSATMTQTSTAVTSLDGDLSTMQGNWFARVAAARTEGGLIPQEAIPGLLAERDRVAAAMTTRVSDAGKTVTDRLAAYEVVVNDAVRLLADQGLVPPAALGLPRPPPPAPAFEGEVDPSNLGAPLTAGYAADPVNTALGNFVEVETDLPFAGLLAGLTGFRTYNSRGTSSPGDADPGPNGAGWSSWATTRLVEHAWTADYAGPDGQRVRFPRTGAGFGRAPGIHAVVERGADGLTLAWFDGRRWDFDAAGLLTRTFAGPGTEVRFVHDAAGRLVELVHERGRRVTVQWKADRIVAVLASDGRRASYRYDDAGRLLEVDGPAGLRRYGLDVADRVVSVTDADGVVEVVNTYDDEGRVLTQRSPFGRTVTFSYAPDGVTVVADDSAGPTNVYRHDHAGRLIAVTDGHGQTQHTCYDDWGNPIEIVERGGAVTRQEFDDRAHLVRRTLPSGAEYAVTWDDADRVTSVTVSGVRAGVAITRFGYEGAERSPSRVLDPESGVTSLQVVDGLVLALTDPDGVTVRLRHDLDGNLVEAVDAGGGVARVERDGAGLATAVITPAGRRTELVHDAYGRLVARRDPAGGVWRHEYSPAGRGTAVVDPTGSRTEVRLGPHGEVAELVDALGAVSARRYDVFGNLADVTAPDGGKWVYRHDALSRPTAVTDPAGGGWWTEYDVDGRPRASIDPTGVATRVDHDGAGRISAVDDGLGVTRFAHDELGRLVEETRADGTTRTLTYDRCGRLRTETGPDGGVTRYAYSPAGRPARVVAPSGREERYVHDDRGLLTTRIDGNGHRWGLRYDLDGLLVARLTPAGLVETIDRDDAGRVVRHRVPGVGTTTFTYDPAGRVVAIADRSGRRAFTHDAAGRVTAATDALGHTTRYAYDSCGRPTAVTDPLGGRTLRVHDELGRLVAATDPLGRTARLAYDAAGRLQEEHEPAGVRRRWTHDVAGRPHDVTAAGAGGEAAITVERDVLGRPVRVTETGAEPITLRWDAAGRLIERRIGGQSLGWSYDADGLRTGLTHPDGTRTAYRRDGAGRVTGVAHPLLGPIDLERDPDGRLQAMTGRGGRTRWTYEDGWLSSHEVVVDGDRSSTRLVRDGDGRVVAADTDGRTRLFTYDAAGQLASAADDGGDRAYTYDPCGRLSTESGPDGQRRFVHDAAGQLVASIAPVGSRRFRHDTAGRRIAEEGEHDGRRYRWDGFGRLSGIDTTAGGVTRSTALRVDALGELTQVGDVPLVWDTADPWGALVGIGDEAVVGAGQPWALADARTGAHRYLGPDWMHTVDATGDPWGTAGDRVEIGYRGELALDGLLWLRERAYDPATRVFLRPDPLPPVPGTAYAGNPYQYAGNDPVNSVDPLGLRPVTDAELEGRREGGSPFSRIGHGVLDVVGLVPGVGSVADLVNAGWYAAEGDYTMAALSALTAIPVLGLGAAGLKFGIKGGRALLGLGRAGEVVDAAGTLVRRGWIEANAGLRSTSSPVNGSVFWSGYEEGNKDLAQAFARETGGKTVEMTSAGRWLEQHYPYDDLVGAVGRDRANSIWDGVATRFARDASGEANAFIYKMRDNPEFPNKTYMRLERPILVDENPNVTRLVEHE